MEERKKINRDVRCRIRYGFRRVLWVHDCLFLTFHDRLRMMLVVFMMMMVLLDTIGRRFETLGSKVGLLVRCIGDRVNRCSQETGDTHDSHTSSQSR